MLWGFQQPIWFYQHPVDFRKQMDGLMLLVAQRLKKEATSGQLFIFRNRQADKLKLLWWDNNGFWLAYKRIEKGRFKMPGIKDETLPLNKEQLLLLLSGIDFLNPTFLPAVSATRFY